MCAHWCADTLCTLDCPSGVLQSLSVWAPSLHPNQTWKSRKVMTKTQNPGHFPELELTVMKYKRQDFMTFVATGYVLLETVRQKSSFQILIYCTSYSENWCAQEPWDCGRIIFSVISLLLVFSRVFPRVIQQVGWVDIFYLLSVTFW